MNQQEHKNMNIVSRKGIRKHNDRRGFNSLQRLTWLLCEKFSDLWVIDLIIARRVICIKKGRLISDLSCSILYLILSL